MKMTRIWHVILLTEKYVLQKKMEAQAKKKYVPQMLYVNKIYTNSVYVYTHIFKRTSLNTY